MNWIFDFQFDTLALVTGVNLLVDLLGAWALLFWSGQHHRGLLVLGLLGWLGGAGAALADQLLLSLLLQLMGVFATAWQPGQEDAPRTPRRSPAEHGMSAFLMRQHDRAGNVTGHSLVMPPRNSYARRKLQSLTPQQMDELTRWCSRMVQRSRCLSVDLSCWPGWDDLGQAGES